MIAMLECQRREAVRTLANRGEWRVANQDG